MGFARAAMSAVIFTVLPAACATAKPVAVLTETNLRKSAGTGSPVLTIIPKGATVEVGKCSKGWCGVSFESRDGFVIARNVALATRGMRGAAQVYDEVVFNQGSPPAFFPPLYYGYHGPYYGYQPYYGYYGGWGGWRW
jgi:uncharacterized protein YraI